MKNKLYKKIKSNYNYMKKLKNKMRNYILMLFGILFIASFGIATTIITDNRIALQGNNDYFTFDDDNNYYTFIADAGNRSYLHSGGAIYSSTAPTENEIIFKPLDGDEEYSQIEFWAMSINNTYPISVIQSHTKEGSVSHNHTQFKTYRPSNGDLASRLNIGFNCENCPVRFPNTHIDIQDLDSQFAGSDIDEHGATSLFSVRSYGLLQAGRIVTENVSNANTTLYVENKGTGEPLRLIGTNNYAQIGFQTNDWLSFNDSLGGISIGSDGSDFIQIWDNGATNVIDSLGGNVLLRTEGATRINLGSTSASYTVPIAMNDNELQRARIQNASAPLVACTNARKALLYYDNELNKPCYCNSSAYVLIEDSSTVCS